MCSRSENTSEQDNAYVYFLDQSTLDEVIATEHWRAAEAVAKAKGKTLQALVLPDGKGLHDRLNHVSEDKHGLLYFHGCMVVPGGRFAEGYGWDTVLQILGGGIAEQYFGFNFEN